MMLKQGAAKQLAGMMSERNAFFPALIELLCREEWPVRLGAMVAVEELHALRPELARQLIDPLWQCLNALPDAIQGDLFYVLGEIGGPALIPRLTVFLHGDVSAEVRDAVQEALEKLNQ
jgi:HEAT repeat protein